MRISMSRSCPAGGHKCRVKLKMHSGWRVSKCGENLSCSGNSVTTGSGMRHLKTVAGD